jgi:hypothetical protein
MTARIRETVSGNKLEVSLGTIGQIILVVTTIVSMTLAIASRTTEDRVRQMILDNNAAIIQSQADMKTELMRLRDYLEQRGPHVQP